VALIAGSLLTGFLLAPLLVSSRNIAQLPARRIRAPQEKQRRRRFLALSFYSGTVVIVFGLIGLWTRWCLGGRDPWLWVIFWILEGQRPWARPALLGYWAALGFLSVAAWNRQLARSRRYWHRNSTADSAASPGAPDPPFAPMPQSPPPSGDHVASLSPPASSTATMGAALGMTLSNLPTLPTLPNLPNGAQVTNVATDLLDAADKHVPTLTLNARRKFFHALAVVMFVPGVAFDVSFVLSLVNLHFFEYILMMWPMAAGFHASIVQRGVRHVHFCGICSLLRDLSFRCDGPSVHERVFGPSGSWDGYPKPLLSLDGMCRVTLAGRVRFFDNGRLFRLLTFLKKALSSATVHGHSDTRSWRCNGRIL